MFLIGVMVQAVRIRRERVPLFAAGEAPPIPLRGLPSGKSGGLACGRPSFAMHRGSA